MGVTRFSEENQPDDNKKTTTTKILQRWRERGCATSLQHLISHYTY
jgi:hypothetical protein